MILAHGLSSLSQWLFAASWQGAILAGVVAAVILVAGKRIPAGWRFGLWGIVLVRMMLPGVVEIGVTKSTLPTPSINEGELIAIETVSRGTGYQPVNVPIASYGPRISKPTFRFIDLFPWLWLTCALLLSLRIILSTARLNRAVARLPLVHDDRIADLLSQCCRDLRIRRAPRVRALPASSPPVLVGFIRPTILLPVRLIEQLSSVELRLILLHELAHVKRRDVLINYLATLVAIAHWFNPVVWLVLWRMRIEREEACDQMVLFADQSAPGHAYARTIVKLVEALSVGRVPSGAMGILEGRTSISRRLLMIARFDARKCRRTLPAVLAALLVAALALCTPTTAQDKTKDPNNPATGAPTGPNTGGLRPAVGEGGDTGGGGSLGPGSTGAGLHLASGDAAAKPTDPDAEKANHKTKEKLRNPIKAQFDGVPLVEVIEYLRDAAGVDIVAEWNVLENVGVSKDFPITLKLREPAPAETVLRLIIRGTGNLITAEYDRGIVILSSSGGGQITLLTRAYDVSDLVPHAGQPAAFGAGGGRGGVGADGGRGGGGVNPGEGTSGFAGPGMGGMGGGAIVIDNSALAQLINLIMQTVEPQSWNGAGGQGSIAGFGSKLIVKNTEAAHKEIAELLAMLRDKPRK